MSDIDFDMDSMLEDMFNEIDRENQEDENFQNVLKEEDKALMVDEDFLDYKPLGNPPKEGHSTKAYMDSAIKKNTRNPRNLSNIGDLTENQLLAIELKIKGLNNTQISKQLGVTRQSIYNWEKNERFVAMLEKTQKDYLSAYSRKIMNYIPLAVQTLVDVMNDDGAKYDEKIKASRAILDYSNIKKGGIQDESNSVSNVSQPTLIVINPEPPKEKREVETVEEINREIEKNGIDFDNVIDVE